MVIIMNIEFLSVMLEVTQTSGQLAAQAQSYLQSFDTTILNDAAQILSGFGTRVYNTWAGTASLMSNHKILSAIAVVVAARGAQRFLGLAKLNPLKMTRPITEIERDIPDSGNPMRAALDWANERALSARRTLERRYHGKIPGSEAEAIAGDPESGKDFYTYFMPQAGGYFVIMKSESTGERFALHHPTDGIFRQLAGFTDTVTSTRGTPSIMMMSLGRGDDWAKKFYNAVDMIRDFYITEDVARTLIIPGKEPGEFLTTDITTRSTPQGNGYKIETLHDHDKTYSLAGHGYDDYVTQGETLIAADAKEANDRALGYIVVATKMDQAGYSMRFNSNLASALAHTIVTGASGQVHTAYEAITGEKLSGQSSYAWAFFHAARKLLLTPNTVGTIVNTTFSIMDKAFDGLGKKPLPMFAAPNFLGLTFPFMTKLAAYTKEAAHRDLPVRVVEMDNLGAALTSRDLVFEDKIPTIGKPVITVDVSSTENRDDQNVHDAFSMLEACPVRCVFTRDGEIARLEHHSGATLEHRIGVRSNDVIATLDPSKVIQTHEFEANADTNTMGWRNTHHERFKRALRLATSDDGVTGEVTQIIVSRGRSCSKAPVRVDCASTAVSAPQRNIA